LSAAVGGGASGLAWAPKVASAPRGPSTHSLAGNPVQSRRRPLTMNTLLTHFATQGQCDFSQILEHFSSKSLYAKQPEILT